LGSVVKIKGKSVIKADLDFCERIGIGKRLRGPQSPAFTHNHKLIQRLVLVGHVDVYVWSAVRLQGKAEGEKTSLRKCIRPLVEGKAPGQDELRAGLSLLVGRLLQTNTSSRSPGTPL
jgi:hypothetical protein